MSPDREEPSQHYIAAGGNASPKAIAAVRSHIENGGARAAFKADREWFMRHPGRRYRMRPLMVFETLTDGATHVLVVRQSRRTHYRIGWRLYEGETIPNTDRELAALVGVEI
jgi:hypothetical protein